MTETMTSRERVIRALRFEKPDRTPRQLWTLPGVPLFRRDELDAFLGRFPEDIAEPDVTYGRGKRESGVRNLVGTYTDEWGCAWDVLEPGVVGEVKGAPLDDWAALADYRPPFEILEDADFSRVNAGCASSDKFILAGTTVRPFERMQFIRGTEKLFLDLAYGAADMLKLREMLHDFFMRELAMWIETDVDGISFMDDWGAQDKLLISPKMWRELYKPLYAEYVDLIHSAGKFAFMHSDGNITSIYPDLIEIGVDALNSQLFCMDIEALGEAYKGKITFWGEIDRQGLLPFGTVDEVKAGVRRVRDALDDGSGGMIAECEWGNDVPMENVVAVYEAWMEN